MPLVRIDLRKGKSAEYVRSVADGVHRALVATMNVPADDRFQLVTEHEATTFIYDAAYMNMNRSPNLVVVAVTLRAGRATTMKQAFYRELVGQLEKDPGVGPDDVLVTLTENGPEDWSFGRGAMPYAAAQTARNGGQAK